MKFYDLTLKEIQLTSLSDEELNKIYIYIKENIWFSKQDKNGVLKNYYTFRQYFIDCEENADYSLNKDYFPYRDDYENISRLFPNYIISRIINSYDQDNGLKIFLLNGKNINSEYPKLTYKEVKASIFYNEVLEEKLNDLKNDFKERLKILLIKINTYLLEEKKFLDYEIEKKSEFDIIEYINIFLNKKIEYFIDNHKKILSPNKNEDIFKDFKTYTQCADVQIDLNRTIDKMKKEKLFCNLSIEKVVDRAISDFILKMSDIVENSIEYNRKIKNKR